MKKLAFLEYAFLFEPETAWANIYDFEKDLSKFLKVLGLEGQIIDAVRGQVGRRIIFVRKIQSAFDDPSKSWGNLPKKK